MKFTAEENQVMVEALKLFYVRTENVKKELIARELLARFQTNKV